MTRRRGIASSGYWEGLKLLQKNRKNFARELWRNHLFLVEFSHYLDLVFQAFCSRLLDYRSDKRPIPKAKGRLEFFMVDKISRTFDSLEMGIVPKLTLPKSLLNRSQKTSAVGSESEQGGKRGNGNKKREEYSSQDWWKTNASPVPAWRLPEGSTFRDFWNASTDAGKANIARLPVIPHHIYKGT